ncbi:hypothetical protein L0152_15890 [bacterium]|nr:hypothetical protein [bacterium]
MRAILSTVLCLVIASLAFSEETYTVILKNGKMMKGYLLSENAEMIVFKDDKGLQYSLKKTVLDLEKMKEANVPPAPPVPEPVEVEPEVQTQPSPETSETAPTEAPETAPVETPTPQAQQPITTPVDENPYAKSLHETTAKLETAFETAKSLLDGMMTAWEVNASTGRDPAAALQEFRATKAATITALADSQLQTVDKLQENLGNPPSQYVSALQTLNNAISELHQYYDAIRQYDGKPSLRVFHSRLTTKEQSLTKKIENLKAIK